MHGETASQAGAGVNGYATAVDGINFGVKGETLSTSGSGVFGTGPSTGVYGSGPGTGVKGTGLSGVVGEGTFAGVSGKASGVGGYGILGEGSIGAYGLSTIDGGVGVQGYSASGTGTLGLSETGVGVKAVALGTGVALRVSGKARYDRAGKASVGAGKTSATIDLTTRGGIASNTIITATLLSYRPGVAVSSVRLNYPSAGKARVYLTEVASRSAASIVGWIASEY